jgi:hypothetical protein
MSRNQVIVYNNQDGFCCVAIPSQQCILSDEDIIAKDIPTSEYAMIDHTSLPSKTFRNAWKYNHSNSAVDVDLASAKDLCKKELEARYLRIREENQEITALAEMRGETPELKSNPAVPYSTITAATTVAELEALI